MPCFLDRLIPNLKLSLLEYKRVKVEDVKEEVEDQNELNVGIAVFLTVAESRYFDYMNVLKGLNE